MRVCVVVTARASWAKLQPICEALQRKSDVDLQIVACASALLERYGRVVDVIRQQGFVVAEEVYSVVEGETLETGARETGGLLYSLASAFHRLRPDAVLVCADRREVLACAQAATYQHIPLVHMQGGEFSGSIDNKVRDAVTALADWHLVCTEQAYFRVYSLIGKLERVIRTGCPSLDVARLAQLDPAVTKTELGGAGIDVYPEAAPFGIVLQHSVTNEASEAYAQMSATLDGLTPRLCQWIVFWPGEDPGAAAISKAIRERHGILHTVRSLPPSRFLRLLGESSVIVGNSSASVREASFLGVPAVLIGTRQNGRQHGPNVMSVPHNSEAISGAIKRQLEHGKYSPDFTYGDGHAAERSADAIYQICMENTVRI